MIHYANVEFAEGHSAGGVRVGENVSPGVFLLARQGLLESFGIAPLKGLHDHRSHFLRAGAVK